MKRVVLFSMLAALLTTSLLRAELDSVQAELNPEKRSELALQHADAAIDQARNAYQRSDDKTYQHNVKLVNELVDLSYQSLRKTGKSGRRSPKYFKRAEQRMHTIGRRLQSLSEEVDSASREPVLAAQSHVAEVEEKVVMNVMGATGME